MQWLVKDRLKLKVLRQWARNSMNWTSPPCLHRLCIWYSVVKLIKHIFIMELKPFNLWEKVGSFYQSLATQTMRVRSTTFCPFLSVSEILRSWYLYYYALFLIIIVHLYATTILCEEAHKLSLTGPIILVPSKGWKYYIIYCFSLI